MKTLTQINQEQLKAQIREDRASMRNHALEFRLSIHPQSFDPYTTFSHRTTQAAFYLELAISSRNRAARYATRLAA